MQPIRIFRKYEKFEFHYEPTGYGSSEIMFRYGEQKVEFHPTYIGSNPLWCLLMILPDLVSGYNDRGHTRWSSEPGEMKMSIKAEKGLAHLQVEELDLGYEYKEKDEAHWISRIDAKLPLKNIAKVVLEEVDRNIRYYGIVGLCESWKKNGDVIPINAYLKLKGVKPRIMQNDARISALNRELGIIKEL